MKYIMSFLILFIVYSFTLSILFAGLKLSVEVFFYFSTKTFNISLDDIYYILSVGIGVGFLLSFVICLLQYLNNRKKSGK